MMDDYQNVKVMIFTSQSNSELLIRHTLRAISRARNDLKNNTISCTTKLKNFMLKLLPDLAVGSWSHWCKHLIPFRDLPFGPVYLDFVKLRHATFNFLVVSHHSRRNTSKWGNEPLRRQTLRANVSYRKLWTLRAFPN